MFLIDKFLYSTALTHVIINRHIFNNKSYLKIERLTVMVFAQFFFFIPFSIFAVQQIDIKILRD